MSVSIVSVVREYVGNNDGRGCPKYILLAQGFSDKDIKQACEFGLLEARRGRDGGLHPAGEAPATVASDPTLKGRMVAILRALKAGESVNMGEVDSILADYDAECQRRSDAKRASA